MIWNKTEDKMPSDQKRVLCLVKTEKENLEITIAEHISTYTTLDEDYFDEDYSDNDILTEYDEKKDCYWVRSNWFVSNLYNEDKWVITDPVIAWAEIEIPKRMLDL